MRRTNGGSEVLTKLIFAGLGIALIIVGLVVAPTPVEAECIFCDGSGQTDCAFCTDGVDCVFCDGRGWKPCVLCDGDGKVSRSLLMLGAMIAIVGISFIPTVFIVSREAEFILEEELTIES